MGTFASALAPVLILILLGFGLKRTGFLPEVAWPGIEKLTYFILFPALLVGTLGSQSLDGVPWQGMLTVAAGTSLIAAVTILVWYRFRPSLDAATFTSVFQGGVRFNTFIALAAAQAIYGTEGLALAAVAAGFLIVLVNLLCVFVLIKCNSASQKGIAFFAREVGGNPLVLACALGWLLSLTGIGLPGPTKDVLEIIGRAALPLGLLAVGAALRPSAVPGHAESIAVSSIVQFGLKPIVAVFAMAAIGLSGTAAAVMLLTLMTPTAPSAYILAKQLGGDAETMSSIITFQTLLAFLAMPVIAAIALG